MPRKSPDTLPTAKTYHYMPVSADDEGYVTDLSKDARLSLLAACIADQQRAGFGDLLDMRQAPCPVCKSPGFNTGWGFFLHTCGAEIGGGEIMRTCAAVTEAGDG